METPGNIITRLVQARFIVGVQDDADPDAEPNWIPAQGDFTFKPDAKVVINRELKIVQLQTTLYGALDDEGWLCLIDSSGAIMQRGIPLWVTDNPAMSAIGWTWSGTVKLRDANGHSLTDYVPTFTFSLPSAEEPLDLVDVLEGTIIPPSQGTPVPLPGGSGPGPAGAPGKSAYELAVQNGFVGSLTAWLASLRGPAGAVSTVPGPQGNPGAPGKSAYQLAVDAGFTGTQAQWLESLKGQDGEDGQDGAPAPGPKITVGPTAPPTAAEGDVWLDTSA